MAAGAAPPPSSHVGVEVYGHNLALVHAGQLHSPLTLEA